MLDSLITSKMRVQILMRLFLNPDSRAYLRELTQEFRASPGHVRSELQQLSEAGLLAKQKEGRQVQYSADRLHPLFPELQSMVRKAFGMDWILESILARLGQLDRAWLIDDYAMGRDTGLIDLVLVGDIDQANLADLVAKTERHIKRKIRPLVVSPSDWEAFAPIFEGKPKLLLWSMETDLARRRQGE